MTIVAVLLDKAKKRRDVPSDNALRERFGVTRQTVSKWRSGDAYPTQDHIAQLATMADEDPGAWLVAVQAERETGAAGAAWAKLARQLGVAATVAAVTLTGWFPAPAYAANEAALTAVHSMHYAKSATDGPQVARWMGSENDPCRNRPAGLTARPARTPAPPLSR